MTTKRIPLDMLFADRRQISFRNIPQHTVYRQFFELLNTYKTGVQEDPIQVTMQGPYYVIQHGFRRALAALETGRRDIDANVVKSRQPLCRMIALKDVKYYGHK